MDNVSTEMLERLEPAQLDQLPPGLLADLHWKLADEKVCYDRRAAILHGIFERRYAQKATAQRLAEGKDTGSVHVTDGEWDVLVNLPKKVEWDQRSLKDALDKMDLDEAQHYAKAVFSVEERKFEAAPPYIKTLLSGARTLKTGKATYALAPLKEAAA